MVRVVDRQLSYTSNFRDNICFIVKVFAFIIIFWGGLYEMTPEYSGEYTASLIDKMERLESINVPKVVLIGNSNLVFGIDSRLLEQEMNMPVVNMGLHGGLGNVFHEQMAKINVHEGDIYILCHTAYDDNDKINDPELAWITIENHFRLWRLIRGKDIWDMIESFPVYLKKFITLYSSGKGNIDKGGAYSRSGFNEYGDCGVQRECEYTKKDPVVAGELSDAAIERINDLNAYLSARGATLLVAGYPIGNGDVTDPPNKFQNISDELKLRLDCEVISNFADYMWDYSYFYDYNYTHLNTEGAKLRTKQLVEDLRAWKSGV